MYGKVFSRFPWLPIVAVWLGIAIPAVWIFLPSVVQAALPFNSDGHVLGIRIADRQCEAVLEHGPCALEPSAHQGGLLAEDRPITSRIAFAADGELKKQPGAKVSNPRGNGPIFSQQALQKDQVWEQCHEGSSDIGPDCTGSSKRSVIPISPSTSSDT